MGPIGEIISIPENVHFPSRNLYETDTQFAAKCTPQNYLIFHSTPAAVGAALQQRDQRRAEREKGGSRQILQVIYSFLDIDLALFSPLGRCTNAKKIVGLAQLETKLTESPRLPLHF